MTQVEGGSNLVLGFLEWWYLETPARFFVFLKAWLARIVDLFSVKTCISTLFMPWKRDYANYRGLSLPERFQVELLNMASRFVGAVVKIATLIAFIVGFTLAIIISVGVTLFWILWPFVAVMFIIAGLQLIKAN